ncbi:MAG: hypothetical protein ACE5EC_03220 [Phycisphaerae bacterium]
MGDLYPPLADVTAFDSVVAGILAFAIASQWLSRRLPRGLGTSLFVFATTVGLSLAAFHYDWPRVSDAYRAGLVGGLLSLLWAFFGWLSVRESGIARDTAPGLIEPARIDADHTPITRRGHHSHDTFFAWSLITGVVTVTIVGYVLVRATWPRVANATTSFEPLRSEGLLVIACLLSALLFWSGPSRRSQQPTLLLALSGVLIWWTSLMIPSASLLDWIPEAGRLPFQPGWWTWTVQLQIGLTAVLVIAALLQEQIHRRRRACAWPDRMDDLILPYSRWPGYIQTESLIAGLILLSGVYQIVRAGRSGWELSAANCLTSLAAGITCLFMTYRRWSANTAGLGMALLTLGFVGLACMGVGWFDPFPPTMEYARRMPILFNAILIALWCMIALWSWLSRFWDQQLLNAAPAGDRQDAPRRVDAALGETTSAWTTAGRMIPFAQRTGFLLTAIAVLIAWQVTLWPYLVPAEEDNSLYRTIGGGGAMLLLALQSLREGRRRDSTTVATFAVALFLAATVYVFLRLPASHVRGWLIQYDAVVLATLALPVLLLAEALPNGRWRAFATPLWFLALLVLPLRALLELLPPVRLPEAWVSPATLAILGALYSFAGSREHRRAFLVLGGVLLLASLAGLYRLYV